MKSFQERVHAWAVACFGDSITADKRERYRRFGEEALELVQAAGCTEEEAIAMVRLVFARPPGDRAQEVGGVMTTLATLSTAFGLDMEKCGNEALDDIWTRVETIRGKRDRKPIPGA